MQEVKFFPPVAAASSYNGVLIGSCVHVYPHKSALDLYVHGCFGKGSTSRGAPQRKTEAASVLHCLQGFEKESGECLVLSDVEAFHLVTLAALWRHFVSREPRFVELCAAYTFLRSHHWVPKSGHGMKFGFDFLLYREAPTMGHAEYALTVATRTNEKQLHWQTVHVSALKEPHSELLLFKAAVRAANAVAKPVLFCFVRGLDALSVGQSAFPQCLDRLTVETVAMTRWSPTAPTPAPVRSPSLHAPSNRARENWKRVDCVCLDVDSTVSVDEGLCTLASHCGSLQEVKAATSKAMEGRMSFQDSLTLRLQLMQPTLADVEACSRSPPRLSPGAIELVALLHQRRIPVFLVSGGFRRLILPIAKLLSIPQERIFANTLLFDPATGAYAGFDTTAFTSRTGGKAKVVAHLKESFAFEHVAMVGDGMTDVEARESGAFVVGFGGVKDRRAVRKAADWFVKSFEELIHPLLE